MRLKLLLVKIVYFLIGRLLCNFFNRALYRFFFVHGNAFLYARNPCFHVNILLWNKHLFVFVVLFKNLSHVTLLLKIPRFLTLFKSMQKDILSLTSETIAVYFRKTCYLSPKYISKMLDKAWRLKENSFTQISLTTNSNWFRTVSSSSDIL